MLTVKNARPDTPGYCSYLSTVEFDLVLQDDELIAVFWYGTTGSNVLGQLLMKLRDNMQMKERAYGKEGK